MHSFLDEIKAVIDKYWLILKAKYTALKSTAKVEFKRLKSKLKKITE